MFISVTIDFAPIMFHYFTDICIGEAIDFDWAIFKLFIAPTNYLADANKTISANRI